MLYIIGQQHLHSYFALIIQHGSCTSTVGIQVNFLGDLVAIAKCNMLFFILFLASPPLILADIYRNGTFFKQRVLV